MNLKSFIGKTIGTSFGFGYFPVAPGTFGALFGVIVYYLLHFLYPLHLNSILIALILIFFALGTWACTVVLKEWGHDPSKIVMDESIGIWITLLFIPYNHYYIWLGFGLFRLFDIWKPLGIGSIDNMKSSFSVMFDDVLAAVYAAIVLQLIIYFFK